MKKETVIAILFGVLFGTGVAVFLLAKNKEFQLTKTKTIAPTIKPTKEIKNVVVNVKSFELTEPKDGTVVNSKNITIKGRAEKDSLIIIQSPAKDLVLKNNKEEFSSSFPLALGENIIKITVHPKDSKLRAQEREIRIYNLDDEL